MEYLGIPIGIGQNYYMIVTTGPKGVPIFEISGKSLFFTYQNVCLQRAEKVRRSCQWFLYWRCIKTGTLSRITCHLMSSRVRIGCTHKCGAGEGDDGLH